MITILSFLTKISIILGLGATIFTSISDLVLKTTYLDQFDDFINLGSPRIKIVLALLAIAYLIIFILSFINRLTKYSQNRKIKNKNTSYFWDIAIRIKRGYLFSYYNFIDYNLKKIYFFRT